MKADALTDGPGHVVEDSVNVAMRAAIVRLVREREAGSDAFAGPVTSCCTGCRVRGGPASWPQPSMPLCMGVWGRCAVRCPMLTLITTVTPPVDASVT